MKIIKLKCPNCGASFKVEKEQKEFFCEYCRTTTLLDDGVIKVEHTIVDKNKDGFSNNLFIFIAFLLPFSISCLNLILSSDKNANSLAENTPFKNINTINKIILNNITLSF